MHRTAIHLPGRSEGTSLIETALLMPLFLLMLVVSVDLGRAYALFIEVSSAAHAGAVYGIHNLADTAGMTAAAQADAPDIPALSVTPTYGCECYDGTAIPGGCAGAIPPSCGGENYVNYVSIITSAVYTPILPYPVAPKTITLNGSAILRSGGD